MSKIDKGTRFMKNMFVIILITLRIIILLLIYGLINCFFKNKTARGSPINIPPQNIHTQGGGIHRSGQKISK